MIDREQYAICKLLRHEWEPVAPPSSVMCVHCGMPGNTKDEATFWRINDQRFVSSRRISYARIPKKRTEEQ